MIRSQQVIAGMKQAKAAGGLAAKSEDAPGAEHVLVSNYGKFGTLH